MGNPRKAPWAMGRKEAGTSVMGQPLVSPSTRPEANESIPSVTMKGAIPTYATSTPFTAPMTSPTRIPRSTANGGGAPIVIAYAAPLPAEAVDGPNVRTPHARERHDRAHRQVDPTGEDYEQLAQGDDCDERDLPRHQVEVAGAEEVRRGNPDRRHEQDEGEEDRRFPALQQGAGDVAAGLRVSLGVHCH